MPNQIRLNDQTFALTEEELAALDLTPLGSNRYHLLRYNRAYHVELLDLNRTAKTLRLRVNGRVLDVGIEDETDQLVRQLGISTAVAQKNPDVLAPMPGLVLDILVEAGQEVEAGTPLIVLEAMKMENVLKAEADGTVKTVAVAKGEAVNKRQLLMKIA